MTTKAALQSQSYSICGELAKPARDGECFAGQPGGIGGRQEHGGRRDVLRLTDPAERCSRFSLFAEIALGNPGGVHAFGFDHDQKSVTGNQ